ncbi:MAG TPA: formimidoylglutamate deiminase [Solirubrobacterales bacterium]|nr:formimidoylglutamate deiminase [Solirubrobacterales bacterium]
MGRVVTAYWCELAWLGGERAEERVVVEVEGERIAAVDARAEPPAGATRLDGLTLPGFANAHSHAFHRALRGRTEAGRGTFWTWRETMYGLALGLDPDSYRALARATFAEMALAGITAVGEFHYLHHGPGGTPYDDPNAIGRALAEAAAEAGIRITLLDTCYLRGGEGGEPAGAQRRFADADAAAWAERVGDLGDLGPHARVGAAIHSVRAVDPKAAATVAAWAAANGSPLHAHVSEQPGENEACLAEHGRTPTAVLAEAGALGPDFTAVHFTHVDEADIALLGGAGSTCCLCPTTERDLADGVGRAAAISAAGARLALGSDSHALIDPFEEMRATELDQRLATNERGHHDAATLLRAATAGGHAAIGWAEAGRIAVGAPADLVTVALDGVRLAGTEPEHALESVIFAASPADVTRVISGGRELVRDGVHVDLDVAAELRASIAAAAGDARRA